MEAKLRVREPGHPPMGRQAGVDAESGACGAASSSLGPARASRGQPGPSWANWGRCGKQSAPAGLDASNPQAVLGKCEDSGVRGPGLEVQGGGREGRIGQWPWGRAECGRPGGALFLLHMDPTQRLWQKPPISTWLRGWGECLGPYRQSLA